MSDTSNPTRRSIIWLVCLSVATVAVAATWISIGRPKAAATTDPLAGFKTVAITSGALSTSESVSGTLELNQVTQVLHRIEGQTSVATTGAPTGSANNSANGARSATAAPAGSSAQTATATSAAPAPTTPSNGFAPPIPAPTDCGLAASTTSTSSTTSSTTSTSTTSTSTTSTSTTSTSTTSTTLVPASSISGSTTTTVCATTTTAGTTRPSTGPSTGGNGGTPNAGGTGGAKPGATNASTSRVTQVVTSLISVGAPVTLGTVLYAQESKPVVAMSGALPAWRTMKVGMSDGPDVQQLELSLMALGYDRAATMKVDQHFDSNTKAAVQRWQAGYGLAVTGTVTLGSVVFLPSPSTVSAVQTKIGAAVGEGDKVVSLASSNQDVVINVPTGDEAFVVPGFAVKIGNVDGTVTLLRSATQNGATVVEAVITPTAQISGVTNGATVRVTIQHEGLNGVLLAPAAALASRLDGSYAIQVVNAAGAVSWVPVEVLATANGNVAIRGTGIAEGTKVLQPR